MVPSPGGNPAPSGRTSMSHPRICSGAAGVPRPSRTCCAKAEPARKDRATTTEALSARIGDDSISGNLPALNCIEVVPRICSPRGNQARTHGLHPPLVVIGPALDLQRLALPVEWQPETGQTFVEDGLLKRGALPCGTSVDRNVDARDVAASRPGYA